MDLKVDGDAQGYRIGHHQQAEVAAPFVVTPLSGLAVRLTIQRGWWRVGIFFGKKKLRFRNSFQSYGMQPVKSIAAESSRFPAYAFLIFGWLAQMKEWPDINSWSYDFFVFDVLPTQMLLVFRME